MRAARRQFRATPQSRQATFDRGVALAYAALYATDPISPEREAQLMHELSLVPPRSRQPELALAMPEADPQ